MASSIFYVDDLAYSVKQIFHSLVAPLLPSSSTHPRTPPLMPLHNPLPTLHRRPLLAPRPARPTITRNAIIAAPPIGSAFKRMCAHSLRLDSQRAGADNAIPAIHALREATYTFAAVGAACAFVE